MVEPAAAKVEPDMAYRASCCVLLRFHLGIEQPRLLMGSGAQNEFPGVRGLFQLVLLAETRQIQQFPV